MKASIKAAAMVIGLSALAATATRAQDATRTVWDGVFTEGQAARGKAVYDQRCTACHGAGLEGADSAPPLSGGRFVSNWTGQSIGDLFERTRTTMPADDPGSLGAAASADVTAYILSVNQYPTGAAELAHDAAFLRPIKVVPKPAGN